MKPAFLFPGQGSQRVGMGKDFYDAFPEARAVFEEVDEALGEKFSQLIFNGPEEELTLTHNAQPAIMATSLAIFRVLEKETGLKLETHASFVAGHSLGEYAALAAAGTFTIADAARLLRLRGQAMQKAVPVGEGAMAALLGMDVDAAQEVTRAIADEDEASICQTANDNAPGQVVISGHAESVEKAAELAREKGARKAVMLSVSAPFHCDLMQPAADAMRDALATIDMQTPCVPLIANVTAAPVQDVETIRSLLVEQVTDMVRWRESMAAMREAGVSQFVEVGVGKVLSGLVRRLDRELEAIAIESPADVATLTKLL